jgi:hypothetical protein
MAAIAMAESSGDAGVVNSIGACGLWQIHPYQAGCQSAQANAKMAVGKYRSQGLTAWEAYTNGNYRKFLRGNPPPPTGSPGPVTTTSSGGLGSILGFFTNPSDLLQRFGLVVFGGLLIIVGVMMISGSKTLELTKSASKSKENGGSKGGVRERKGGESVLRDGAGTEEETTGIET